MAAYLRDFASAEALLSRAESLGTKQPWVHLQRAHLLERQDRVEEALEAAEAACRLHAYPYYRPGVQVRAHLLQLLDRDEKAVQLLSEANSSLQNAPVAAQLYGVLTEQGEWREAEATLERYVALSPLMEPPIKKWVASQRARAAYYLGKRADAAAFASNLDDEFHKRFAQKLAREREDPERVQLAVNFVRQHFKTCAPATLAALGRFWRMPAEHLKLTEAMCYDGTPHWLQRDWAENNGWFVREFRVTWDAAVAILSRGIPFAISTVEATFAHMQAVTGFDRTRGTLLLRDPGQPYIVEVPADEFIKRYRPFGPHGTLFLPVAERSRIEGLALPDSDIWDDYHRLCLALSKHHREEAARVLSEIDSRFPEHELAWEARLELASYDANNSEQARCLDKLLELFSNNPARQLRRFGCLRDAPREERIRFLKGACAAKDADTALFIELARALQGDARCLPEARQWLKRAFSLRPMDSNAIGVRADLCWQDGNLEEATELYRFAANLEGFREALYQTWFIACRRTRHTQEALTHLQDRFARFGRRSEQPALTLAWAWRELDQPARSREVLAEAAHLRPEDGMLLLRSASLLAGLREDAEADRLLDQAKGKVRENDWLRAVAERTELRFDTAALLKCSREILRLEPLALDAHGGVARALARLEGNAAALAHLKNACAQFPHHCALQRLLMEWSRHVGLAAVETAARDLLRLDPADAWAKRELAMALSNLKRQEEALREATEAAQIEPRNTFSFSVLGHIHRELQQVPDACTCLRKAVELSVDNTYAIHSLIELAHTDNERRDELLFIERELIRQVVQGDGLLVFLDLARPLVEPDKLLKILRRAHAERPDLWHAWSALISQAGHTGQLHEARDLAREAVQKFPHLPRLWLDLASVHQWCNEPDEETAAAEHAFEMNPAWTQSALAFAGALERRGRMDQAQQVYERALKHSDSDAQLHAFHANLLWRQRQKEPAFAAINQALRLAPGYDWAWGLFIDWANSCGEPGRPAEFSRALAGERPGEVRCWLIVARVLNHTAAMPERLAAVEKALELDRHLTEAWDLKAELLAEDERFDDAIRACEEGAAVCTAEVYMLHGRRAWVEARRRQLPEAVRLMRKVLAENVSYAWGWNQLALWLMEQEATADATAALERLLQLRPREAWVHRQLGSLRLKAGDRPGAQKAFSKALELAPTDAFAAQNIVDLQLQAGELENAAATLRLMEMHQPGARTLAYEIFLHLRTNDRTASIRAFEKLCSLPDPDGWPVDAVTEAFRRAGRSARASKILKRALKRPSCNPQAGAALVRLQLDERWDYAAVWQFMRLKPGEIRTRAATPLMRGLAQLKSGMLFRWVFWRRRGALSSDDMAWGQTGYALISFGRMKEVAHWLSDWRQRQGVQPWMLFNLCLALRHLGRYEEANSLARHVLETLGHREGSADLRLFLAVEDALAGAIQDALQHLEKVVVREDVLHDRQLVALARALVEFQQCSAAERPGKFRKLRSGLEEKFSAWKVWRAMKDVRRTFRRSGKAFVQRGAGWRARLWFGWKLNWQWLLVPLIPFALILVVQPPVLLGLVIWRMSRGRK